MGKLKAYAFITEQDGKETYNMHRLVRLAMRNWLAREGLLGSCLAAVVKHLDKLFPFPDHANKAIWMQYLPHALAAFNLQLQREFRREEAQPLLAFKLASSYDILGKDQEAENLYREAVRLAKFASDPSISTPLRVFPGSRRL